MSCGNESERQVWLVQSKDQEWTAPARCQLEAWDTSIGTLDEETALATLGLIVRARPMEASNDHDIAIHAVGLAMRYGWDQVALAAETAGLSVGMPSVRGIYEQRGQEWIK